MFLKHKDDIDIFTKMSWKVLQDQITGRKQFKYNMKITTNAGIVLEVYLLIRVSVELLCECCIVCNIFYWQCSQA